MNTEVAERPQITGTMVDDVIARGDLKGLTPEQRATYYVQVCRSLGLNHLTQPFQYITLNGQLKLYARKDATDQLRKINGIDIKIIDRVVHDGLLTVHVRATDKTGRGDEDFGVVSVAGLKGEAAANAMMKGITKAKRRVTLAISGLGWLDENEVEAAEAFSNLHPSMSQQERSAAIEDHQGAELRREPTERPPPPADLEPKMATDAATGKLDNIAQEMARRAATGPFEIAREDDSVSTWSSWATLLMGYIRAAPDVDTINEWTLRNADHLAELQKQDPGKHERLNSMIQHQIAIRVEQGT